MGDIPLPESLGKAADLASSLPAGLSGTMDGEKPPMSRIEELKKAVEPYQQKYGHYLAKIRPWREFLRLSKPNGDAKDRLQANLTHFQINYAVLFLILLIVSIITTPSCLITVCVLGAVWVAFLKKNDDPNWEVNLGGMPLGKTQRWMALAVISAIVLLSVAGQVISSAVLFWALAVGAHAVMHAVPVTAAPDETAEMI